MTVAATTAGPYYNSGPISFSSLRSKFRAQVREVSPTVNGTFIADTGQITASELRRSAAITDTNPMVPDSTENSKISTLNNWKTSQFRNSIKYYYIVQTNTELNLNIATPPSPATWNGNLDKNIQKYLIIGAGSTCGSNDATLPAAKLNATAYNLIIDVSGSILGAGGSGGGTVTAIAAGYGLISGQKGGDALDMTSPNGANNIVLVRSGAKIYGGGGGGEKGVTGATGSNGTCSYVKYFQGECGCPGCPSPSVTAENPTGWQDLGCGQNYGNHCSRREVYGCWGDKWWASNGDTRYNNCKYTYAVSGGLGGEGGTGGLGRGYNNQSGLLSNGAKGADGLPASTCTSGGDYETTPAKGLNGEDGANGGNWAVIGGNTTNTGNGGGPGRAIFGSNYSITGPNNEDTINTNTIKGSYL